MIFDTLLPVGTKFFFTDASKCTLNMKTAASPSSLLTGWTGNFVAHDGGKRRSLAIEKLKKGYCVIHR